MSFTLSRIIPSDPVRLAAGSGASEEMVEALRSEFGLDKPLHIQFVRYVAALTRGDLGRSLTTRRPVVDDLKRFYPATLELVIASILFAIVVGIPAGMVSASYEGRWPDGLSRLLALGLVSVPGFWLALLVQMLVAGSFSFLPISGRFDANIPPPDTITGLLVVDSILALDWRALLISIKHLILPAIVLSAATLATITRMSRTAMIAALGTDFVLLARASGMPKVAILYSHALKHALIPVLSMVGLAVTWSMAGSVLVETIFNWPGLGHYVVEASLRLDYNPIMGTMLVLGITAGITTILTDIGYTLVDPRIRESTVN
jgi:peptide/nickel transport system permease protein